MRLALSIAVALCLAVSLVGAGCAKKERKGDGVAAPAGKPATTSATTE